MEQSQFQQDNWHRDAKTIAIRNGIKTRRWGMRVTVYADPTPANNGDYVLSYNQTSTNLQDNGNWLKVADIGATWGGGGSPTAYWKGGWNWAANANALPAWSVGEQGYGIGDRFNIGDSGYVPAGVLIVKIGAGNTFADFLFR